MRPRTNTNTITITSPHTPRLVNLVSDRCRRRRQQHLVSGTVHKSRSARQMHARPSFFLASAAAAAGAPSLSGNDVLCIRMRVSSCRAVFRGPHSAFASAHGSRPTHATSSLSLSIADRDRQFGGPGLHRCPTIVCYAAVLRCCCARSEKRTRQMNVTDLHERCAQHIAKVARCGVR